MHRSPPPGAIVIDALEDVNGSESTPAARSITVRPVGSIEQLIKIEQMIAAQFPSRRSSNADTLAVLKERFQDNRMLMLAAEMAGALVGGALAHRTADAVEVDVIAVVPEARQLGIGRQLMEAIETEAIHLGARTIVLGGANSENRGFYWRLGFAGRKSLMQKGLPLANRFAIERRRALTTGRESSARS